MEIQGHNSPQRLEGSSAVEVSGVISDDLPGNISSNSPMFSSFAFLPSSTKTHNISVSSILLRRFPRLNQKSLMITSPNNAYTPITTNSHSNKKVTILP